MANPTLDNTLAIADSLDGLNGVYTLTLDLGAQDAAIETDGRIAPKVIMDDMFSSYSAIAAPKPAFYTVARQRTATQVTGVGSAIRTVFTVTFVEEAEAAGFPDEA